MGQSAVRIAAEDFVTPPELRDYRLASSGAGRIGGVRLELVADKSGTRFGYCYQQIPLRVLPPFKFHSAQPALVYLLNPTAGLMDGDGQLIDLSLGVGANAIVIGQSATRVHPCLHGFATQQWHIRVATGASLTLLPGPTIPFRGCRYFQNIHIHLAQDSRLCLGDIWHSGRYARGPESEQFQFETIIQEVLVFRHEALIYRDRFSWRGPWDQSTAAWHFGDSPACASCFVTGPFSNEALPGRLERATFPTAAGDTVLRWCGPSEAVTNAVIRAAGEAMADTAWLTDHDLAPCHWFSPARQSLIPPARESS